MPGAKHLLISGGGPAGAFTAYLLARAGVRVTLVERHMDLSREFRGEGISPSGAECFRQAGIWQELLDLPGEQVRYATFYSGNRRTLSLPVGALLPPDAQQRLMPQGPILDLLLEKAGTYENFHLVRGAQVTGIVQDGAAVTGLKIKQGTAKTELLADYVLICEGRSSSTRGHMKLELSGGQQTFDIVWHKLPKPDFMRKGEVFSFMATGIMGIGLPATDDQLQIGIIIPKGKYRKFRGETPGGSLESTAKQLPTEFADHFRKVKDQVSKPILLDVQAGHLHKWSLPGMCFLGDAAHPMSPMGAQGINLALRDAVVFVNHFGPKLLAGADANSLNHAADMVERERREEIDKVQAQQNAAAKYMGLMAVASQIARFIPEPLVTWMVKRAARGNSAQHMVRGVTCVELKFGADKSAGEICKPGQT